MSTLEERVAALEEMALAQPVTAEMTEEQAREFERDWQEALSKPQQLLVPPQRPPLGEDEIRQLLRECVTVVKPGETLYPVLRAQVDTEPDARDPGHASSTQPSGVASHFKALVVPGEELGVAEAAHG